MERKKIADCNGLANAATGICIFLMAPVLLGKTTAEAAIGCLPWMLCAVPVVLIAVTLLLVSGDIVGGMANALLTGMALFNNIGHALRMLYCSANGVELTEEVTKGIYMMDGCAYLAAAVFLLSVVWISTKVNLVQAIFVACPCVAFVLLFCSETLGMGVGILPGCFLMAFGCWLIYSGMAMMLHNATGKQVLPYIVAPKRLAESGKEV